MILVGIDVGGSGTRIALGGSISARHDLPELAASVVAADPRAAVTVMGEHAARMADGVPIAAVAIGAAGLTTHAEGPPALEDAARGAFGTDRAIVTSDIVTAHLGALGGTPGAVLAAGTGSIALGTDLADAWHRVDGWGHLLGDLGSGAWIGMEALRAAAEHLDGRRDDAPGLADVATAAFGDLVDWPAAVYPAVDRARIFGALVPHVVEAADDDAQAARILDDAASHLAVTLLAALADDVPERVTLTGGLARAHRITDPLLTRVRSARPGVEIVRALGSPLDGAIALADRLREHPDPLPGHVQIV
ncbi:N-acetylglucosamine kinase [Microbacterium halotolerans]|uniref:N-acetylglucosamine kinase n=1 Tax=Microbacterium halotolerans TaxID=246613 RepID=UPI000E6AC74E|nr:BadF/BadG/BcrA/BcrD ATPase family protein [Microbacterium halotolerans]